MYLEETEGLRGGLGREEHKRGPAAEPTTGQLDGGQAQALNLGVTGQTVMLESRSTLGQATAFPFLHVGNNGFTFLSGVLLMRNQVRTVARKRGLDQFKLRGPLQRVLAAPGKLGGRKLSEGGMEPQEPGVFLPKKPPK